jgi:hypothetical protein
VSFLLSTSHFSSGLLTNSHKIPCGHSQLKVMIIGPEMAPLNSQNGLFPKIVPREMEPLCKCYNLQYGLLEGLLEDILDLHPASRVPIWRKPMSNYLEDSFVIAEISFYSKSMSQIRKSPTGPPALLCDHPAHAHAALLIGTMRGHHNT